MVTEKFDREQAIANMENKLKDKIQEHGHAVMGVNGFAAYSIGLSLKPETPFEFVVDTKSVELGGAIINELVRRVKEGETFEEGKAYESTILKLAKDYDPKEGATNVKTKFMVVKVDPLAMLSKVAFWWVILPDESKSIKTCYLVTLADKDNVLPMEKEGYNKDKFVESFLNNKSGFWN